MVAPDVDELMGLPDGEARTVLTDDGAELAVHVVDGHGPTIVLAHGWTNTMAVWGPVARALADAGRRVVLYDQRGHGGSTFGEGHPRLSSLARPDRTLPLVTPTRLGSDLLSLLQALDLDDTVLVGHSMGGFSVLAFAAEQPFELRTRVRGMLLLSTAARRRALGPVDGMAARLFGSRLSGWTMGRPRVGQAITRPFFGRRASGRPSWDDGVDETRRWYLGTPPPVRAACFSGTVGMDLRSDLGKADVPARVVVGRRDVLLPPRLSRELAAALPDAHLEVVPGAGHMLPLEVPWLVTSRIVSLTTA
jgi:pimeloyl-ACP methyl ester carboxylesterase